MEDFEVSLLGAEITIDIEGSAYVNETVTIMSGSPRNTDPENIEIIATKSG
jgi:hypothetical protein